MTLHVLAPSPDPLLRFERARQRTILRTARIYGIARRAAERGEPLPPTGEIARAVGSSVFRVAVSLNRLHDAGIITLLNAGRRRSVIVHGINKVPA